MQKVHDATKSMLNGKRVLLVDDEPDVLDVLKEEIRAAAPLCVIYTAQSYRDAAALLASWTYDLAILDING
jgi:CheY-like chemotaxis protein